MNRTETVKVGVPQRLVQGRAMSGHDHRLARLLPCPECGAPSGAPCLNWSGHQAMVPCPPRLAAIRSEQPPVLLTNWLTELEEALGPC